MFLKFSIAPEFKEQNPQIAQNLTQNKNLSWNGIEYNPNSVRYQPFSRLRPELFANHDLEAPKTAATQNSPPTDLLGEICGAGLDLL